MKTLNILLEIAIYSGILFSAIMLLKLGFKNRMSPFLHFAVWGLLIARLLIPVTMESSVRLFVIPTAAINETALEQNQSPIARSDDTLNTDTSSNVQSQTQANSSQSMQSEEIAATISEDAAVTQQTMVFSTKEILLAIWLLGVGIGLLYLAVLYAMLRKRIHDNAEPPSTRLLELFDEVKAELNIKRNVRIIAQCEYAVPAVLFPKMVLMPVSTLVSMNDEQVKYVLRHELMHFKRGDHFMSLLLSLLNAVYWFNPIVWIAFKQIRADMETACDSDVVRHFSNDEKSIYAAIILSLFSKKQYGNLVLGMVQGDTKKIAEKRIRGVFMNHKTNKRVKAVAVMLTAMLLFTCFTTACKPTPEKSIVQSKDNDSVAQAIEDSANGELHTFAAPVSWQSQADDEDKNIAIYVDAKVDVPTDTWGLYELQPIDPTFGDVQTMLDAIVADATIYGEQTLKSKEYLIEQIARWKSQKAEFERLLNEGGISEVEGNDENGSNTAERLSDLTDEELRMNIEIFSNMIAEAEAKLPTAPAEDTVVKNKFVLADMFKEDITPEQAIQSGFSYGDDGYNVMRSLNGTVDLGRQTPADINIYLSCGDYNNFTLRFIDYDDYEQGFFAGIAYTGQELFKCDITVEEAAGIARAKVKEMGFDYLDIDATYVCGMLDRKRMEGDQFPECFEFVFTRSMDGATATFARGDGMITEEEELALEYAPYWEADEVEIYVDDSGVINIKVNTQKSDVVRQAYGIQLKDFEEIMDIFETQVFIENAFDNDVYADKVLDREIHIDSIRLGYMPTAWKDHAGQIIYVPVWDFFGYEVVTYDDGIGGDFGAALDEDNRRTNDLGNQSLLTINALDGTIMMRQ